MHAFVVVLKKKEYIYIIYIYRSDFYFILFLTGISFSKVFCYSP